MIKKFGNFVSRINEATNLNQLGLDQNLIQALHRNAIKSDVLNFDPVGDKGEAKNVLRLGKNIIAKKSPTDVIVIFPYFKKYVVSIFSNSEYKDGGHFTAHQASNFITNDYKEIFSFTGNYDPSGDKKDLGRGDEYDDEFYSSDFISQDFVGDYIVNLLEEQKKDLMVKFVPALNKFDSNKEEPVVIETPIGEIEMGTSLFWRISFINSLISDVKKGEKREQIIRRFADSELYDEFNNNTDDDVDRKNAFRKVITSMKDNIHWVYLSSGNNSEGLFQKENLLRR
ncbi:MAG: hypothetical protein SLAVMIC_00807 [uncultured marine phage]|uniref:Uncharacterized protein n=1 Tax=uncultured marine phage TaxID=707152 RepID=A0A8D9FRE2_9VIRU|nr:MAG: hypothetical protein SLAVMIC_00807 [uncultured marine phage]